ncbi:MAG TPA: SIR2 family protein [Terriglobia bacterium]|nr:SIR2 family protein [Terriglobia bacterium]
MMEELVVTVILGAGASRDVSYAKGECFLPSDHGPLMPSPLDSDFFDLLQRFEAQARDGEVKKAMRRILDRVFEWRGEPIWQSMEKIFYSLHVSAALEQRLIAPQRGDLVRNLVNEFLLSIRALLNEAHGTRPCNRHAMLLQHLYKNDGIITFNYDFVAERALAQLHGHVSNNKAFGDWFYGFSDRPNAPAEIPTLYKLHGSLNWELEEDCQEVLQNARKNWPKTWNDFDKELEYLPKQSGGYHADGCQQPPILLPYWDKRVEKGVWLKIWKAAAEQLLRTHSLIVWGYSLPTTDLKARELLRLACLSSEANLTKVAVIDPSRDTRDRWRSMFVRKQFWGFSDYDEFQHFLSRYHNNLGPFRTP